MCAMQFVNDIVAAIAVIIPPFYPSSEAGNANDHDPPCKKTNLK